MREWIKKKSIKHRITSLVMAFAMVLTMCVVTPGRRIYAAGTGGVITADGTVYTVTTAGDFEVAVMLSEVDGNYVLSCSNPDSEEMGSVVCNGITGIKVSGYAFLDINADVSLPDGISIESPNCQLIIDSGNTVTAGSVSGTSGQITIYGTLSMPYFIDVNYETSDSRLRFILENGTLIANNVSFENEETLKILSGTIQASTMFTKGTESNISATVIAEKDGTIIDSAGGSFTLQLGSISKVMSGSIYNKKAGQLLKKDPNVSLGSLSGFTVYQGTDYDFSSAVTIDADYDGEYYFEYRLQGGTYSTTKPTRTDYCYARVVAPATDTYCESISDERSYHIDNFPLSEIPTVSEGNYVTLGGVTNGVYVKDTFTLTPKTGYQICIWENGTFYDTLTLTMSDVYIDDHFNQDTCFYMKRKSDEAMTGYLTPDNILNNPKMEDLIFDEGAPIFEYVRLDGEEDDISEGETVIGEKAVFCVGDANLDKVVISPDNTTINAEEGIVEGEVEGTEGETKDITITAYDKAGRTTEFSFSLKYPLSTPTASVSVPNTVYGTSYEPVVTTNSNGTKTFRYKVKGADDSTYSGTPPRNVGTYTVEASISETGLYEAITCTSDFTISRKDPEVTITVPNTYVDETYTTDVETESDGTKTIEYKVKGADDSTYTTTAPTAAGDYTVRVTIDEAANFNAAEATKDFTISRITTTATLSVPNTTLGQVYAPELETNSNATPLYEYKLEADEDSAYSTTQPEAAGKYMVRLTLAETAKFTSLVTTAKFTIGKKTDETAKVVAADCYVDDEIKLDVTSDSTGARSFLYKEAGAEDSEYDTEVPTAAGEYTVQVTIAETATYYEIVVTDDFTISKITTTATLSVPNTIIEQEYGPALETNSNATPIYEYKLKTAEDTKYTTTKPEAAGEYMVRLTLAETEKFTSLVTTAYFTISKKTDPDAKVVVDDCRIDDTITPEVTTNSTGAKSIAYKVKGADDSTYTATAPNEAGEFTVRAIIAETATYEEIVVTDDFTIGKKTATVTVTVDDCFVGDEIKPVVDTVSDGKDSPEFAYKVQGADDSTYDIAPPTAAGDYTVRVTIPETANYELLTDTDDFSISRFTTTATLSVPDSILGESYAPSLDTNSNATPSYKYKKKGADDSTYVATPPTAVGSYTAQVTLAETATHTAFTTTADFTIGKKTDTTAKVTIADIKVGEPIVPNVTSASGGEVSYQYKASTDTGYSSTVPTKAGEYDFIATIAETDEYNKAICEGSFKITKYTTTATLSVPNSVLGDTYAPSLTTNSNATPAYKYKVQGADDSTYNTTPPKAAGSYTAQVTLAETESFTAFTTTADFTIDKKVDTGATVTISDIVVGGTLAPVVTTESKGAVSYQYKASTDSEYSSTVPKKAGEYDFIATIEETDEYKKITFEGGFSIRRKTPSASLRVPDTKVGKEYAPIFSTDSDGKDSVTFMYKGINEAESAYMGTKPTAIGEYMVRAIVPQTDTYERLIVENSFRITAKEVATATVKVGTVLVGKTYTPVVTTESDGKATFEYKEKGAADTAYTGTPPTAAGSYTVRATVPETETYEAIVCEGDFTISRWTTTATLTISNSRVGDEYAPSLTTNSDATPQYKYKKKDADASAFTSTKPTAAGSYTVQVILPETDKYKSYTAKADFDIEKNDAAATVSVPDTTEGTRYTPTLTTDSDGKNSAEFMYKKSTADDSTYSETRPTKAGSYTVRVTIPETAKYKKAVCTATFKIYKAASTEEKKKEENKEEKQNKPAKSKKMPVSSIQMNGHIPYGTTYEPRFKTDSDSKEKVKFYYKNQDTNSGYFTKKPASPGTYVVEVRLPETDNYKAKTYRKTFRIDYLRAPSPAYHFSGTLGKHDYYTSDIKVMAPRGFEISTTPGKGYGGSVAYDDVNNGIYLRRKSDGAMTAAIPIRESLKKDADKPEMTGKIVDDKGNEQPFARDIYANEVSFSIRDEHLVSVRVNGVRMQIDDNLAEVQLAAGGGEVDYSIEAEDEAGNVFVMTIHLMAAWMKDGVMPEGEQVVLKKGRKYGLREGKWTIGGERTIYNGGSSFYVREDKTCSFKTVK